MKVNLAGGQPLRCTCPFEELVKRIKTIRNVGDLSVNLFIIYTRDNMKTVLLIEDNDDIRENTSELLELEGYYVLSATNGQTGLQLARKHLPDMVLCDIMMPVTNGYEVFRELKAQPLTSAIPFIFLTANTENKDMEAGMRLGANGYIRKPFSAEELLEILERYLPV